MIKTLLRGVGGGFGRVLGRFICYLFIAFILYMLITYLDIDIKSILPKVSLGGLLY